MSGIYHSRDFGQSWQMLNFHSGVGGVNGGSATQFSFTSDPNILYIYNSNQGFVKSTDRGSTFARVTTWTNGTAYWVGTDISTTTKMLVSNGSNSISVHQWRHELCERL